MGGEDFNNIKNHLENVERNIILNSDDPVLQKGFTQVPNHILRDADLSTGAKLAYAVILSYAWNNDYCFPGQERLAQDMGVSDRSVRTYIKDLEDSGFLEVEQRGLGKTNIYSVNFVVTKSKK